MADEFCARYGDLLTGTYDCVDRVVINAYFSMGHSPRGFRVWWRRWQGDEANLDAHLMRMAGRFARRVRGWAKANDVPVIDTKAGDRKHLMSKEYLDSHEGPVPTGVFMVLVARAPATVWKVKRSNAGVTVNLAKRSEYVNHYSFHIMNPTWGHVTIKMSGPPFGAQVILNGHEYVAAAATRAGVGFQKEGNCFTVVPDSRTRRTPHATYPTGSSLNSLPLPDRGQSCWRDRSQQSTHTPRPGGRACSGRGPQRVHR